jgi:hypothetical protein
MMSRRTRWLSHGLALAAFTAALSMSGISWAQFEAGIGSSGLGITINPTVPRFTTNGQTPYPYRPQNLNPNDINFKDCSDNIVLQFTLLETGLPTTDTLQVWAGPTDCTQQSARISGTSGPFCWRVAPNVGYGTSVTSSIFARNVTQFIDDTSDAVLAYNASPNSTPGVNACHTQQASGAIGMTIYFMFVNGNEVDIDASATYPLNVDMVGPLAPLDLTAGIGDTLLILNWSPQTDSTIQGFNLYIQDQGVGGLGASSEAGSSSLEMPIYCPTSGASTTCVDAGTADGGAVIDGGCTTTLAPDASFGIVADASSLLNDTDAQLSTLGCYRGAPRYAFDAGGPGAGSCVSTVLVDTFMTNVTATPDSGLIDGGESVIIPPSFDAGDTGVSGGTESVGISEIDGGSLAAQVGGNTTSSYTLTTLPSGGTLINGHQYAVAVAAFDDDGNVGLLSNLACQTPAPVVDFWNQYGRAGGLAGGGFCNLQGAGIPAFGSVFGLGIGLVAGAFMRRRRRRNP